MIEQNGSERRRKDIKVVYHLGSYQSVSRHEFGKKFLDLCAMAGIINAARFNNPCKASQFKSKAPRPLNSSLDSTAASNDLKIYQMDLEKGLEQFVEELKQELK